MSLDTRSWMDDDVSSILDDNILENNLDAALDISPVEQRRRESMMDGAIYSPSRDWTDFDHEMGASLDGPSPIASGSYEHSNGNNNPFIKLEAAQQPFSPPNNAWSARAMTSGSVTPAAYDAAFASAHFDPTYLTSYAAPASASYETATSAHITPNSIYQAPVPTALPSTAPSRPLTKRMRPQSPARPHSPLNLRRDGIRKKNARFDIPAERTLLNIDTLIAQSADDQEIKELKQQKRLLRNRQAALDSRQRKKQHTERLEEEKKIHSTIIAELEEKVALLTVRDEEWRKRFEEVSQERDFARHQSEVLQLEKEEMVKNHTLETGELRKKNNYLENQLQKMETVIEQNNISTGNTGGAYSDDFPFEDEMNSFWSGPAFPTSDPFDIPTTETKTAVVKKETAKPQEPAEADKPAASGILFLLLLCGAFVASSSSSQAASSLPPLPQPIRTASAGILQSIFQDAGVTQNSQGRVHDLDVTMNESWTDSKSTNPKLVTLDSSVAMLNAQFAGSSLESDRQQFSQLTASEYNDVTSKEFLREPEPSSQRGRKHLEEGLASMRSQHKPSLAEVYTRSLLWDKVDVEVVRRFAAFAQRAAAAQASEGQASDMMV
ncbi:hypothetical protein BDZ91DRAFT_656722 [Kalaharituber pfeilii]|nr:hypothetical protein BDZ91DRAFT_656722 [Kalaharituber pfeilii]